MKKEQLIIVGLIVLVGLGLHFFGRTSSGPGPDIQTRTLDVLKARQVPVIVITAGQDAASATFLKQAKELVAAADPQRVKLLVVDSTNPNEKAGLSMFGPIKPPVLVIIGLDLKDTYRAQGEIAMERAAKAITDALARPPAEIPTGEEEGHQH